MNGNKLKVDYLR